MAKLYGVLNCFQYPLGNSIRMTLSTPMAINHPQAQRNLYEHNLYAMNGGDGPNSYAQNSSYQRGVVDISKPMIEEAIMKKLAIKHHLSTEKMPFRIADFGCSTGDNSFPAMEIITEAVAQKYHAHGLESQIPDFQVFFNDQVMNDFNTLFHSLPPKRKYHAAGVPGPFHGRLLPTESLDFAYSSCALNWLSKVPGAVADSTSPAWNKGRVHYTGARKEVFEAYSKHYANNIQSFLDARAQELMKGGLMTLLVPAVPAFKVSDTSYTTTTEIDLLGSCLDDMVKTGRISEEKMDSFNFPLYFTIPEELEEIIQSNPNFTIERMEILENPGKHKLRDAKARGAYLRAVFEGLLMNHFGSQNMDELFDRYTNKIEASQLILDPINEKSIIIFVLLKRKAE